ncbi:Hypothetical protein LUCI_3659 [Lucifera butyrica]|uniref:Uncharacterized protein n=1 Tax=Lucifera butyrica TaxID=1351585 RepID=A0A498RBU6_9FIRM|nr:hypothetical protein [Lucifera butyrica]VBB08315.1 Hypothetical protein LUCI_3586 [Lucifera butyrica]VBB08387.1 Hypothetical protein LUCI_3659 [Lucifera butyrica]
MDDLQDLVILLICLAITVIFCYFILRLASRDSRLMKKLSSTGVVALARIDRAEQTGTMINDQPQLRIWVTAYPENRQPVQLVIKQVVPLISIPQVQVGSQVTVAYNPNKIEEAIILSQEYTNKLEHYTSQDNELNRLLANLYTSMPEHQENNLAAAVAPFGKDKYPTFTEVIQVANSGQYINGHPIQNVVFKVNVPENGSREIPYTLLAPSFAPYERGEMVEMVYSYVDERATGVFSRSPEYKYEARSKFGDISQAVYHLTTVNPSGYYMGDDEFFFIKAQVAFDNSVIEVEIVAQMPKTSNLQPGMNISNYCWRENYSKKARLQKQKRGIAKVDYVETSKVCWGQNPLVKIGVTVEDNEIKALIEEPVHTLRIPEVGNHVFVAYSPLTKEATLLGGKV